MDTFSLWSLRLGFSNQQSSVIAKMGIETFVQKSMETSFSNSVPDFLKDSPQTLSELREKRQTIQQSKPEEVKQMLVKELQISNAMKVWWLQKMQENAFPLREKMTCFWHNHFVATYPKVKVNYWIFQHNQLLREHAFGNFKELTKKAIKTNAMVRYLDNVDNKNGKINENLSRELLELFTLGIGNYTEKDIQNGAKALAGLGLGPSEAMYRKPFEVNEEIEYLGKKGYFKADDLVDIIFEQPNIPHLITRKILQWFLYDTPEKSLVTYYGDYFRKVNFEIKPLLLKIFTEEFRKNTAGTKIKNPIEYSLQLLSELNVSLPNPKVLVFFLKEQGMDLYNQPNVKGWQGGNAWLTSQIYMQRNNVADLFCNGKTITRKMFGDLKEVEEENNFTLRSIPITLEWKKGSNIAIIDELSNRLLFQVDDSTRKDFEDILKYDFDANSPNANAAVLRLCNAMFKTPEFQLI